MAKKSTRIVKLKLDSLLRIKDDVEAEIKKCEFLMRKNNSRPKTEEPQIDFDEIKTKYENFLDQLLLIKDAIRIGNSTTNKEGKTNDHNIFVLSNLNRRKAFLNSLNTFEGKRTTMKSAGKEIEFEAKLTYKKVDKELKEIEASIRDLETKLSDFNHATEVSVTVYTELNLV
jgi:hypothetical protein